MEIREMWVRIMSCLLPLRLNESPPEPVCVTLQKAGVRSFSGRRLSRGLVCGVCGCYGLPNGDASNSSAINGYEDVARGTFEGFVN